MKTRGRKIGLSHPHGELFTTNRKVSSSSKTTFGKMTSLFQHACDVSAVIREKTKELVIGDDNMRIHLVIHFFEEKLEEMFIHVHQLNDSNEEDCINVPCKNYEKTGVIFNPIKSEIKIYIIC